MLIGELEILYKCNVKIVTCKIVWGRIMTKHYRRHVGTLVTLPSMESYTQTKASKRTLGQYSLRRDGASAIGMGTLDGQGQR